MPILSNVMLEKKGDTLTFLATDIEIQIMTFTDGAQGDGEDGAITVGARKFQDILRSLPEASEISLSLDNARLQLKGGKSRFALQTLPADDFPRMLFSEGELKKLSVSQKSFKRLLMLTQFSMAAQDVRYYLNGLLLLVEGKNIRAVATDGHRLAYASMNIDTEDEIPHQEMILPRKTVLELNRLLSDNDDDLLIELMPNQVRFQFGRIQLVSKLIDGKFPDYERVIPGELKNTLSIDRVLFYQSMLRASILTTDKFRGVRLILSEGSLKVIAANAEQEEAQDEIEVSYEGDPVDVGFNVVYLIDMLSNMTEEAIEWSFNDAGSSALFSIHGDDGFKYVVMPMRI